MKARHWVYACCVAVTSIGGCGDDDDGGGSTAVDTGLPPSDTLDSLDEEDAAQACVAAFQSFSTVLPESELEKVGCVIGALNFLESENEELTSEHIAECKELSTECLEGEGGSEVPDDMLPEDETDGSEACEGGEATQVFDGCEATVADYERCAGAAKARLRTALRSITCDALKNPEKFLEDLQELLQLGEGGLAAIADSSECKALQSKCPEILESSDEESGGEEEDFSDEDEEG